MVPKTVWLPEFMKPALSCLNGLSCAKSENDKRQGVSQPYAPDLRVFRFRSRNVYTVEQPIIHLRQNFKLTYSLRDFMSRRNQHSAL